MSTIIQANGRGKKHTLNHQRKENDYALRDAIADTAKRRAGKTMRA